MQKEQVVRPYIPNRRTFGADVVGSSSTWHKALDELSLHRLDPVYEEGFGTYASADILYGGAFFSRDALYAALHLRYIAPEIVRDNIFTALKYQSVKYDFAQDAQPGLPAHEVRFAYDFEGRPVSKEKREILERLGPMWGGSSTCLRYYGAKDTAGLLVNVILNAVEDYGQDFLKLRFTRYNGKIATVEEGLLSALGWIERTLNLFGSGLLENDRKNEKGHVNPFRADSHMAYVHILDKGVVLANHDMPKTSVELGGQTYDALYRAADFYGSSGDLHKKRKADDWRDLAKVVRTAYLKHLWMEEENYFALGTDRDPATGKHRQIATKTVHPLMLLSSGFFEELNQADKEMYIEGLVTGGMAPDMLTEVGLVARSRKYGRIFGYPDYWGSESAWGVVNGDVLEGFIRQGMPRIAEQLAIRLLNVKRIGGLTREFVPYTMEGIAGYNLYKSPPPEDYTEWPGTNFPESNQTWTHTSEMRAILFLKMLPFTNYSQEKWQRDLEERVLRMIPIQLLLSEIEAKKIKNGAPKVYINTEHGKQLETDAMKRLASRVVLSSV